MSKDKVAYDGVVLDLRGRRIRIGSDVAYAVRVGNVAELRIGKVEFIESVQHPWNGKQIPMIYAKFAGNLKVSRCGNPENMVVL